MAPFAGLGGLGDIGDDVKNGVGGVVSGAEDGVGGVASTVQAGAVGVAATVTEVAGDVAASATEVAGEVAASATKIAGDVVASASAVIAGMQDEINKAKGLLKWIDQIRKLEAWWNQNKNMIIFIFALIVTIYILLILYCCFHCFFDFCRCCCCYIKCTYHIERWCWKTCGPCCMRNCNSCCQSVSKRDFHACSRCCVRAVPEKMRNDLEKQHGDLRKGWCDPTYVGRACGRYELPNDSVERSKWHWWGHEDGWVHRAIENTLWCLGGTLDKEKRLVRELRSAEKRDKYFTRLSNGVDKLGDSIGKTGGTADKLKDRVNKEWAQTMGVAHLLTARLSRDEKALARAKKTLRREKKAKEVGGIEKGSDEFGSDTSEEDQPAAPRR